MQTDYRVRTQITDCLQKKYLEKQTEPFVAHIAFQVAFCYHIGFGVKSDGNKCRIWLMRSNKELDDLRIEIEAVRPTRRKSRGIRQLSGLITVDLINEYRTCGLFQLEEALKEYEREVADMRRAFGDLHLVTLGLYTTIGNMLDAVGNM